MEITKKQILAGDFEAFQRLLLFSFCAPTLDVEQTLSQENCHKIAIWFEQQNSIEWQEKSLKEYSLSIQEQLPEINELEIAYLRFCFETVLVFQLAARLDAELNLAVERLQNIIFLNSLKNIKFWLEQQTLKNLIDLLCMAFLGWEKGFGQHSDNFSKLLLDTIEQLETISEVGELKHLEKNIQQQLQEQQAYLQRFAERMQTSELGKVKNQAAQYEVYNFLNWALADKLLPQIVIHYINDELISTLHHMLVQQGLNAQEWRQAKLLITDLFSVYQSDYQVTEASSQIPDKLQNLLFGENGLSSKGEEFFSNIAFDITQLKQGLQISDCQLAEAISLPDHIVIMEKVASAELLQQVQTCKVGQWFLFKSEQGLLRCQLLTKLDNYQRVLLSNFVGQKVLVASYDEFAYLLSSQKLQALPSHPPLLRSFHSRLDRLVGGFDENYQRFIQLKIQAEQEQREQEEQRLRQAAAEKAKQEALEFARLQAEAQKKAKEERLALEQERLAAEQEQQAKEKAERDEQLYADLRRHARLSLDTLALGSWAELFSADGKTEKIKLAVKFTATGRFVFVDDDGMTKLEAQRDELIEMLISERLKLLESDKKFAERLAKIVTDLRTPQ